MKKKRQKSRPRDEEKKQRSRRSRVAIAASGQKRLEGSDAIDAKQQQHQTPLPVRTQESSAENHPSKATSPISSKWAAAAAL